MLHSMTGFARESAEAEIGALTWEIRAVNHRYLDVQFRLPEEMRAHEQAFRQAVAANLNRGKVECSLHFRRAFDRQSELQINTELVELIGKRIKEMSAVLPATGAVNPFDVAATRAAARSSSPPPTTPSSTAATRSSGG